MTFKLALTSTGGNGFGYSFKIDGPKFFVHTEATATVKGHTWSDNALSINWSPGGAQGWNEYLGASPSFHYSYGYINPIWPF